MQKSPRDGAASTSILEKGSPANKVLAVIMALIMAFTFIPLPGRSAQAYAKDDIAAGTSGDVTGGEAEQADPVAIKLPLRDRGEAGDQEINVEPEDYALEVTGDAPRYNASLTATGLVAHYNAEKKKDYWIGIAVPWKAGQKYAFAEGEYDAETANFKYAAGPQAEYSVDGKDYDTFYFRAGKTKAQDNKGYVAVKAGEADDAPIVVYNVDFTNVKLVYDIYIDPIENGKLELISDDAEDNLEPTYVKPAGSATEGDFVKFKATSDKHYLINEVKATYTEGEEEKKCDIIPANQPHAEDAVSTQDAVEGDEEETPAGQEFAFSMPPAPVTLSATFTNISDLEAAVDTGEDALQKIVESVDGTDVFNDELWATAEERQPLVDAVDEAKDLIAGGIASEAEVKAAAEAISTAGSALEKVARTGKKFYKDAFKDELVKAQGLLDDTPVSSDGSNVRNTEGWVTYKTKGVLEDAIAVAKEAEQGASVDYKAEYEKLNKAVEAFEEAEKPGKVDSSELDELIETLEEELDEAVIAEDPATVEAGETFYTPESAEALNEAIIAANEVSQKSDASQAEIDAAEDALYDAAEIFAASAQTGTKGSGIDISKATIAKIADQTYTTKAIEPKLAVSLDKKELVEGTDFTVSYKDNIEVGKATATITGKGAYEGKATAAFEITSPAKAAMASMPDLDPNAWYMGGDGSDGGFFPGTKTLYLDYALARELMSGYTKDGKVVGFGPNNSLKRAQAATVLYRMANADISPTTDPAKYEANQTGLSDVEDHAYYTAAVNWAYKNGVMTGYTDDAGKPVAFGPDDSINREQIATTIGRWCMSDAGGKMPKPTKKASDLYDDAQTISDWAQEGAAFCNENGIMTGVGGTKNFDPKANAERCQMAKIIAVTDKLGSQA